MTELIADMQDICTRARFLLYIVEHTAHEHMEQTARDQSATTALTS